MSKYTTEVRYICEMNSGFSTDEMSSHTPDEIIAASREKIFNFSYPIYDNSHKSELETKILKHYYTREICAETVGLWKLWLNERLNLIMPKYNKLYELETLKAGREFYNIDVETHSLREDDFTKDSDFTRTDNLLDTTNLTRTDNLTTRNTGTTTDSGTRATADKFSDTPQGTVSNVDNNTYLTEYRKIDETNGNTETLNLTDTRTGTQTNAGTVGHTGTQRNNGTDSNYGEQELNGWERGYKGGKTYAGLMIEYAEKVISIDNMIINELSDLFIYLW